MIICKSTIVSVSRELLFQGLLRKPNSLYAKVRGLSSPGVRAWMRVRLNVCVCVRLDVCLCMHMACVCVYVSNCLCMLIFFLLFI